MRAIPKHAMNEGPLTPWLPKTMKQMGRGGAPKYVGRVAKACKRCKKAKNKCDDSRPCRRCLFMGK